MANKYSVQVRMREMSKQEEILAKRKREIERRLKEEATVDTPAAKKKTTVSSISSNPSSASPSSTSAPSGSSTMGLQLPNKFSNDGSFLEQFKKMAKKETDVKEEKPQITIATLPEKLRGVKPTAAPTQKKKILPTPPPPITTAPLLPTPKLTQSAVSTTSILEQVKAENDLEKAQCLDGQPKTEGEPDWFQDALKRAQAKAKELLQSQAVSLSACHDEDESSTDSLASKKRRSRWGEKSTPEAPQTPPVPPATTTTTTTTAAAPSVPVTLGTGPLCLNVPASLMGMVGEGEHMQAIQGVMVTKLTRNNPVIISYAHKVFGSLDLSEAQWRQCEDQMKMNVVYQLLQAKKQETERLERQGKVKYEYDSDEDTEGGTWEHKRRAKEMQETQAKAVELTNMGEGKHHIGDFLPPDELARFMEKYRAIKEGRDPDLSDYQNHKLTEENVGYRMLKSMGWTEGMGLGAEGKGITAPVNQNGRSESQGLGVDRPDSLAEEDDEYDAYRKRMMLAYRFRPNPLNNPRRAYY